MRSDTKDQKGTEVKTTEDGTVVNTDDLTKERLEELFEKIYNENKELFDRLAGS